MPEPVNPEIEELRWDAKMLHGKPAGTVWLADAEAADLTQAALAPHGWRCVVADRLIYPDGLSTVMDCCPRARFLSEGSNDE